MEGLKIVPIDNADTFAEDAFKNVVSAEMLRSLKEDDCLIYFAVDQEVYPIGIMAVIEDSPGLWIRYIYVLPEERRMGVGSALLQNFILELKKVGYISPVTTWFEDGNDGELLKGLFQKQLNFGIRPADIDTDGQLEICEAFWNGMSLTEMEDLLEDDDDDNDDEDDDGDYEDDDYDIYPETDRDDQEEEYRMIKEYEEINELNALIGEDD
ncbi:MAG: GNAT family N-acetyltransferase [Lachnospiraceae bacterium]|nr:GNAT family N-acetyltransferase [Lachnospiraceae bacterium]